MFAVAMRLNVIGCGSPVAPRKRRRSFGMVINDAP
jgi:hypothetical protein